MASCLKTDFIVLIVCTILAFILFVYSYFSESNSSRNYLHRPKYASDLDLLTSNINCFKAVLRATNLSWSISKIPKPLYITFSPPFNYTHLPRDCVKLFYDNQAGPPISEKCFQRVFPLTFYPTMKKALSKIQKSFADANIELYLDSGSVIGSWRFHGIVPYDDDIDFRVLTSDKPRVRKLLQSMSLVKENQMAFRDTEKINQHWKLGIGCSIPNDYKTSKLQIDFFFSNPEKTRVKIPEYPQVYTLDTIYPLGIRPFEGVLFSFIHSYSKYFKATFEKDLKMCKFYNHGKLTKFCPTTHVDCNRLQYMFRYVKRLKLKEGQGVEFLIDRHTITAAFLTNNTIDF